VTHSILHGFNYSPSEASFPGWIRYGTYFSERNTWWPYFRKWSDYKARLSYLLQNAIPRADVAILQPLTDLWLKYGPQRDPFPGKDYPDYQHNLWEAVHQNGGGCDYVSERIIREASFEKGLMKYRDRSYSTLLLPEIETLDPETIPSLEAFVKSGGRIVFIKTLPFKSTSAHEPEPNDQLVKSKIEELVRMAGDRVIRVEAPGNDLISWYGKLQEKSGIGSFVTFDRTHKHLSQCSFLLNGHPVYFLANSSILEDLTCQATFDAGKELVPWIWDPETGRRMRHNVTDENNSLELTLSRATSLLIVFEENKEGEIFQPAALHQRGEEIEGAWDLQLEHMNGERKQIRLERLGDLSTLEQTMHFAGKVVYEKTITLTGNRDLKIDLGNVQGVTELSLNGRHLGTRWYGAHVYDLGSAVKEGENRLSISLTTITGNYLKGLEDNPTAARWTGHQRYITVGIMGPVKIM
jgi:hypothetical protein